MFGSIDDVPKCFFDEIDEQSILKATINTKRSAGTFGMDSYLFCRILCSKHVGTVGKTLRERIVLLTRNLATNHYHPSLIESYVAARLIPSDKNPGIRPICVGEVLRRIIGKVIIRNANEDIKKSVGPLQTSAGHNAGAEAAIQGMRKIFESESTDAVLLIARPMYLTV